MVSETQLTEREALLPNAELVSNLIESEADPVVRSLLRLAYGEFVLSTVRGEWPEGGCDLLYCFRQLQKAFRRKDALQNALSGDYGQPDAELDWT